MSTSQSELKGHLSQPNIQICFEQLHFADKVILQHGFPLRKYTNPGMQSATNKILTLSPGWNRCRLIYPQYMTTTTAHASD